MPHEPNERSFPAVSPAERDAVTPDGRLDTSGLACPLPLLKAKQALAGLPDGGILEVVATDPGSWRDFESFAAHSRHELIERIAEEGRYRYRLRKATKGESS